MIASASHADGKSVIGPYGNRLSIADLPQPGTQRWVIRRKAEIVAAVQGGLISLEEACSRYVLTVEEFLAWQHAYGSHGLNGLRVARYHLIRKRAQLFLRASKTDLGECRATVVSSTTLAVSAGQVR
jgi:hypothetical protein